MDFILLIDDEPIANMINERVIQKSGISQRTIACLSALKALEILQELHQQSAKGPDIIFLDINMPAMDGFEFLDELNNFPEPFRDSINIAMLTSSLDESDKERSFKYKNVVDFINKPLNEAKIKELTGKIPK